MPPENQDTTATETTTEMTPETEVETVETVEETSSLMGAASDGPEDEPKEGEDEDQQEAAVVPESYELTPPEGFEITPEVAAEITPVLKELNLSNDQANKLMPLADNFAKRIMDGQTQQFEQTKAEWAKAAKADPEIGGQNWKETETFVARALDIAGATKGSDFRNLLDETGLGNHPEMIRMFRFFGQKISEDPNFVRADSGAQVKLPREAVLYPNDAPKEGVS